MPENALHDFDKHDVLSEYCQGCARKVERRKEKVDGGTRPGRDAGTAAMGPTITHRQFSYIIIKGRGVKVNT